MGYPVWDPSVSRGQIPPGTHREYQGPVRYDIRDPSGNCLGVLAGKAGLFRARERNCQGANGPGSERARERTGQVLLPNSLLGATWPGNEKARYRPNNDRTIS